MIVEQACRFRMDSGYGISARSPGITSEQEKVIGDVFNDTMNKLFPKLGSSVLSCTVQGQYALYARNTLRTDAHNRITIFTHTYVLSLADYDRIMRDKPELLLCVPMSAFQDLQVSNDLDSVELSETDCRKIDVDTLCQKYRLHEGGRYGKLLMGAYEALSTNRSLRLYGVPEAQAEEVVRELTLCILDGLMPAMKPRVSFSSSADNRMRFSVLSENTSVSETDLIFGVFDDRYTNLRTKDSLRQNFFQFLGTCGSMQRSRILERIDDWLSQRGMVDCISVQMIAAAYTICCAELTADTRFALFRTFGGSAGKMLGIDETNRLLTELVRKMIDAGKVGTREISNIAEWYLQDSSVEFRNLADQIFLSRSTTTAICAVLMKAALSLEKAKNIPQLLHALCSRVDANAPELDQETRQNLVLWVIDNNDPRLLDYCQTIMKRFTQQQMMHLALGILDSASRGSEMTGVECGVVSEVLQGLLSARQILAESQYLLFDQNIPKFNAALKNHYISYLYAIRLPAIRNMGEQLEMILHLRDTDVQFRASLEATLKNGNYPELWEAYQTKTVLVDRLNLEKIIEACRLYNSFKNPAGPFETRVREMVCKEFDAMISKLGQNVAADPTRSSEMSELDRKRKTTVMVLGHIKRINLSVQSIRELENHIVLFFWKKLPFSAIFQNNSMLDRDIVLITERLFVSAPPIQHRYDLLVACGQVRSNPKNTVGIVNCLLHTPELREEKARKFIMNQVYSLLLEQVMQQGILNMDLLMIYATRRDTEVHYDYQIIVDVLNNVQSMIDEGGYQIRKIMVPESIVLADEPGRLEELTKKLEKSLSGTPGILFELIHALHYEQERRRKADRTMSRRPAPGYTGSTWSPEQPQTSQSAGSAHTQPPKANPPQAARKNPFNNTDKKDDSSTKGIWGGWLGKRSK